MLGERHHYLLILPCGIAGLIAFLVCFEALLSCRILSISIPELGLCSSSSFFHGATLAVLSSVLGSFHFRYDYFGNRVYFLSLGMLYWAGDGVLEVVLGFFRFCHMRVV